MSGVTRWEVVGEQRSVLGTRYRMLMRVGSAEVGGLIEVVEWSPERDMAWSSVTGVDQRGRWRLRGGGRTRVELRFAYGVAGSGIIGSLAEHVAAPSLRSHLRRSLQQLKRQVEHEKLRRDAAAHRPRAPPPPRSRRGSPPLRLIPASSCLFIFERPRLELGVVVELLAGAARPCLTGLAAAATGRV
jgi:hypothetical protein